MQLTERMGRMPFMIPVMEFVSFSSDIVEIVVLVACSASYAKSPDHSGMRLLVMIQIHASV